VSPLFLLWCGRYFCCYDSCNALISLTVLFVSNKKIGSANSTPLHFVFLPIYCLEENTFFFGLTVLSIYPSSSYPLHLLRSNALIPLQSSSHASYKKSRLRHVTVDCGLTGADMWDLGTPYLFTPKGTRTVLQPQKRLQLPLNRLEGC
jgi:hypothetical protein